jgi:CheY-like chemotaxis protein
MSDAPRQVLVVDDNRDAADSLAMILETPSMTVGRRTNGAVCERFLATAIFEKKLFYPSSTTQLIAN